MTTLTNEDIAKLQRYVSMAQDLQTYRGYSDQMKDIQVAMQSNGRTIDAEQQQQWQKQIEAYRSAQQDFPGQMQEKYRVENIRQMSNEMRSYEPLIQQAYQQQTAQPLPQQELLDKAHTAMQEEQQRRQGVRPHEPLYQQQGQWQQSAAQRAAQPLSTQEMVKQMQHLDKTVREGMQLLEAQKTHQIQLSEHAQRYLTNQTQNARESLIEMAHQNTEALEQFRNSQTTYQPLAPQQLVERAREMNTEAYQNLFKQSPERNRVQSREPEYGRGH